jgi:hypothetical protein
MVTAASILELKKDQANFKKQLFLLIWMYYTIGFVSWSYITDCYVGDLYINIDAFDVQTAR